MFEENEMEVLRKVVGKIIIDIMRSQQIQLSRGIQPINSLVERRRRKWGKSITRMDAEIFVKI